MFLGQRRNSLTYDSQVVQGLVSIIIPTAGKRLASLRESIQSALEQDYKLIEAVVVSDGAPLAPAAGWFNDNRLKYIESAVRWGNPSKMREIGFENSSGQYICFLDDDDILYPSHISTLMEYKTPCVIPFTRAKYILSKPGAPPLETLDIEPENPDARYYQPEAILMQNIAPISSFLIERSMHVSIGGFDLDLIRLEDWDYWARMAINYTLVYVDKVTSEIRLDMSRESRSFGRHVFRDTNRLVGARVGERLQFMHKRGKCRIDENVRRRFPIPTISLVIIVDQIDSSLEKVISSIFAQSFWNFELIVVLRFPANLSTGPLRRCLKDKRVKICIEDSENPLKGFNLGLSQAIGRYIGLVSADAPLDEDSLKRQFEFLETHRDTYQLLEAADVCGCDALTHQELLSALGDGTIIVASTMMRRETIEALEARDEAPGTEWAKNYDIWLRVVREFGATLRGSGSYGDTINVGRYE